ncbi:lytic transglycosylase [Gilvimarinus polysaccharolyticus]|uniref:lytic transglycosylase n=1 Tax=Gilvimarinus polysaccharolyticus TaxID=863921 RepID=UPI0009FC477D|nr:LysM peptidoglycan-binding domain-containing protein [Gilvimarinus polysaccharolyticus]
MTAVYRLTLTCLFSVILSGCGAIFAEKDSFQEPIGAAEEDSEATQPVAVSAPPIAQPKAPPTELTLLDRVRSGLMFSELDHTRVDQYENWYAKHPEYIDRVFERGQRYLYYIVQRLEEEGLPLEIALLPVVESAFDPFAYSHATAAGMWQFMSGTAGDYGLKENWWYDGRRDVVASTNAAISYLKRMHTLFDGDWLLALAAYNTGQGRLLRAIKANKKAGKSTDFWSLKLPRETQAYVPQLLALSHVVANPEQFKITLPEIPNAPYFVAIDIGSQLDLAQAAELAGITMEELYLLNPGFNRWATDPAGPHSLLIPSAHAERFSSALATVDPAQRISWERYKIRSGDSLIRIANNHNTNVEALKSANQLRSSRIRAGDTLLIPTASAGADYYELSVNQRRLGSQKRSKGNSNGEKINYTVRKGDSFWRIANNHQVSVSSLARWNGMSPRDTIKPGQKLVVWSKNIKEQTGDKDAVTRKLSYKVRNGDSLARIASRFNVSIKDITRWNKVSSKKYIHPGQQLTLFIDVTKAR